jgi:DNA-directed RNA polymerase specialized sigma24 family protein
MRVEKENLQQYDECTQGKSATSAVSDRYAFSIFAYTRWYTFSWEDAEDVTLEAFTAALEQANLSALIEQQQLVWLRCVAHNKLVDRYRRSVDLSVIPLEQVKETVRTEEALTPEEMVLQGEQRTRTLFSRCEIRTRTASANDVRDLSCAERKGERIQPLGTIARDVMPLVSGTIEA